MAKKKTKSDWMLQKWAEANGYLDDLEPSVDLALKEEAIDLPSDVDPSICSSDCCPMGCECGDCIGCGGGADVVRGEEAGKDYAGTCTRCHSDNTKRTKSQTGSTIGLCNDCGETWPLKEAISPDVKGGEIPLGKTGELSKTKQKSPEIPEKKPLQPERSLTREVQKGEIETKSTSSSCPKCGSTNTYPMNVAKTDFRCNECGTPFTNTAAEKAFTKGEGGKGFCPHCRTNSVFRIEGVPTCWDCGRTYPAEQPREGQYVEEVPLQQQIGNLDQAHEELQNKLQKQGIQAFGDISDVKGKVVTRPEEPDPSNPSHELNPNPELPPPVDATAPDSDNRDNSDKTGGNGHEIQVSPQTYTAEGVNLPDKIEIPERLFNDLMMMIEYSTTNDNEAGGFLIKAKHGELGVVGEQFGKDREIVLEPNEQLHEGEELIGTVHMHPVTPTASTGDVSGYLNDKNEKVMVVVGADKSINFFFKIPDITAEGDYGDEISENFEQEDMGLLAEGLGFIWYRGEESDRTTLNLMDNIVEDLEFEVLDETWPVEKVVKALGIKGRPDIPEEYSTKKNPLKLQIPWSYCPEFATLVGKLKT